MKTTKWICATSCAALLAMSACDNQLLEKTNTTESPKLEVQLQSANATLGYDETLNELAMSLSYAIEDSPELRMELVNAFEGIGKRYLQLVDLVALESLTPLGSEWQKYTGIFLSGVGMDYPNIYLSLVQDFEEYIEKLASTRNGGEAASEGGNNLHYAVVYRPLGAVDGDPLIGYENGDYSYEVSDVEADDHLLFIFEGPYYAGEHIRTNMTFAGQGEPISDGITVKFRIATKKSRCKDDFSGCDFEIKWNAIETYDPYIVQLPFEENAEYIELALAGEPTNIIKEYVMFPIDADTYIEDLENQETIAYIEPKLYPFNPNIGDYGGFRLELTPYTEQ